MGAKLTAAMPRHAISIATMPALPPPVVPRQIAMIGMTTPIEVTAELGAGLPGWLKRDRRGLGRMSRLGDVHSLTLFPAPAFRSRPACMSGGNPHPIPRERAWRGSTVLAR